MARQSHRAKPFFAHNVLIYSSVLHVIAEVQSIRNTTLHFASCSGERSLLYRATAGHSTRTAPIRPIGEPSFHTAGDRKCGYPAAAMEPPQSGSLMRLRSHSDLPDLGSVSAFVVVRRAQCSKLRVTPGTLTGEMRGGWGEGGGYAESWGFAASCQRANGAPSSSAGMCGTLGALQDEPRHRALLARLRWRQLSPREGLGTAPIRSGNVTGKPTAACTIVTARWR